MFRPAHIAALALLLLLPLTPCGAAADPPAELDRRLAERVWRVLEARAEGRLSASEPLPALPAVPELPRPPVPAAPGRAQQDLPDTR